MFNGTCLKCLISYWFFYDYVHTCTGQFLMLVCLNLFFVSLKLKEMLKYKRTLMVILLVFLMCEVSVRIKSRRHMVEFTQGWVRVEVWGV